MRKVQYDCDVEKGAAPAKAQVGRREIYPWRTCGVGFNFFVQGKKAHQMAPLCTYWNRKLGARFTIRSRDADGKPLLKGGIVGVRIYREE